MKWVFRAVVAIIIGVPAIILATIKTINLSLPLLINIILPYSIAIVCLWILLTLPLKAEEGGYKSGYKKGCEWGNKNSLGKVIGVSELTGLRTFKLITEWKINNEKQFFILYDITSKNYFFSYTHREIRFPTTGNLFRLRHDKKKWVVCDEIVV